MSFITGRTADIGAWGRVDRHLTKILVPWCAGNYRVCTHFFFELDLAGCLPLSFCLLSFLGFLNATSFEADRDADWISWRGFVSHLGNSAFCIWLLLSQWVGWHFAYRLYHFQYKFKSVLRKRQNWVVFITQRLSRIISRPVYGLLKLSTVKGVQR